MDLSDPVSLLLPESREERGSSGEILGEEVGMHKAVEAGEVLEVEAGEVLEVD